MHDLLVESLTAAGKPHDSKGCGFCASRDDLEDAVADPKSYTENEVQAQVQAAVDAAVARVRSEKDAEISQLQASQAQAATDAAVAAATEELNARLTELQNELDVKTAEAATEKAAREALETANAERDAEATRAAETASRKDARIATVREIANLAGVDELVAKSADRWAAMADADFETIVDNLKDVAAKAPAPAGPPPRRTSPMTAAEEGGTGKRASTGSVVRDIRDRRYSRSAG